MAQLPKEKAKELVGKYMFLLNVDLPIAKTKLCAIIAVDEIMISNHIWYEDSIPYKYWNQVKKEIENL